MLANALFNSSDSPSTRRLFRLSAGYWLILIWLLTNLSPALANSSTPPEDLSAADWHSIQSQIQAHAYTAEVQDDGSFRARNPVHGLDIIHAPDGSTELRPHRGSDWRWRLSNRRVGGEVLEHPARVEQTGQTVTYHWSENLHEWWVNEDTGLEQWFELQQRPAGLGADEPLQVEMQVSGDLQGVMAGEAIAFNDAAGATVFTYDRLKVWDATGQALDARMGIDGQRLMLSVADAGAVYPLTIDPVVAVPGAYLKASNDGVGDRFGSSVAVSGDTLVVGAPYEDSNATSVNGEQNNNDADRAGAAYVFVRDGGTWTQQAYLKASNAETLDFFGISVAVSGDTVVVGAPDEASNATTVNGDQGNNDAFRSGAAYVFVRSNGTWSQQAYLKASNAEGGEFFGDFFGNSVAVSGDTVVVGAYGEASNATTVNGDQSNNGAQDAGAAYVFVRNGTSWTQQAYLKASNAEANDRFGDSVAVSGDTVVVGAFSEESNATTVNGDQSNNDTDRAGAAYVFVRNGTTWTQQAYLKASNAEGGEQTGDLFGNSVAVSVDTVVIGAWFEDSNTTSINGDQSDNSALRAGAAYVFVRDGTDWSQQAYLKASNAEADDRFGGSVAVSGDTVVVGAPNEDSNATAVNGEQSNNGAPDAGAAYVFVRNGTTWTQQDYLKASNAEANDLFGVSVAVSGDTVVIGALNEDSNTISANNAGAAYVFDIRPSPEIFRDGFEALTPTR